MGQSDVTTESNKSNVTATDVKAGDKHEEESQWSRRELFGGLMWMENMTRRVIINAVRESTRQAQKASL